MFFLNQNAADIFNLPQKKQEVSLDHLHPENSTRKV
jgi:hypothetical protein